MASRFVVGNLLCNWNDDVTWWICQNNFNMNLIDKRPKGCRSRQISQKCPKCIRYTFFVSNKKVSFLCIERWISNDKHYKRKECQKMFIINVLHFDCTARTREYGHDTFISLYCFSKFWFSSFWSSKSFKEIFVIRKLILSLCYPTYNKKKFIISFPLKSGSYRCNAIIRPLEKKSGYYIELRTSDIDIYL